MFEHQQKSSGKSLKERFQKLVVSKRRCVKENASSSGINEVLIEREQLLDDLILEIDEHEETVKKKEEQTDAEKKLVEAGEAIRSLGNGRKNKSGGGSEGDTAGTQKMGSLKKLPPNDFDGGMNAEVMESFKMRRKMAEKTLRIAQEKWEWEKQRAQPHDDRFERTQNVSEWRIALDEGRFKL